MTDTPLDTVTDFLRDTHTAQEDVQADTTQDTRHQRMYQQWNDFCSTMLVNLDLQDPSIHHIKLLHVYGNQVHHTQ